MSVLNLPNKGFLKNRCLSNVGEIPENISRELSNIIEALPGVIYVISTNTSFPEAMWAERPEYIGQVLTNEDGTFALDPSGNPIPHGFGVKIAHKFGYLSQIYCGIFEYGVFGPNQESGGYSTQTGVFCGKFVTNNGVFTPEEGTLKSRLLDGILSYTGTFDEKGKTLTGGTVYDIECSSFECGTCSKIVEVITVPTPVSKYFPNDEEVEEEEEDAAE